MKKIVSLILALLVCVNFNNVNIEAEEFSFENKYLEDISTIVPGGEVKLDGEWNKLYVVFNNQNQAINSLKVKIPLFLLEIKQYGNLDDLSVNNWNEYRIKFREFLNNYNGDNFDEDIVTLSCFFDIFDNKYKNEEILEIANSYTNNNMNVYNKTLALLLPYESKFSSDYRKEHNSINAAGTFNKTAAINYAIQYATSPNIANYYYFTFGDCANFVSQIFEAGGLIQSSGTNIYYGWWHHYSNGTHTHSNAWSTVEEMVTYFTVAYSCSTIYSFTNNLSAGNAIALDETNDGDWDHVAFVVNKATVATGGYFDCRIAQHTSNYCEWISSSKNKWESYSGSCKYARIRA